MRADNKKTLDRKRQLSEFYECQYSCNGSCPHLSECSQEAHKRGYDCGYDSAWAARLGRLYDLDFNGTPVRIVIVGKEATSKATEIKEPAALAEAVLSKGGVNQHYQETYKMLCAMLNYWDDTRPYRNKRDGVVHCFCLTNLFRCKFSDRDDRRVNIHNSDAQKKYCPPLLCGELDILEPAILVLQNSDLKATDLYGDAKPLEVPENAEPVYYSEKEHCHIVETCHPCAHNKVTHWLGDDGHYKRFLRSVGYLRERGILPDEDSTEAINNLL